MAYLRKRRKQYYSIIRKWNGVKQITTTIPLKTDKKDVALMRTKMVERVESDIKSGTIHKHQFKGYFEWLNDEGKSELILLTLEYAVEQFIDSHSVNISKSSIKRIIISLNNAIKVWGNTTAISSISIAHIEEFKKAYIKKHSLAGINLNLRNIKTFLRWCNDRELIRVVPKIKMLKEPKQMPKYLSENNFMKLMNLESLSNFMKGAFSLLLTTGIRRTEMICGILEGNMLIVPATLSKSREERQISLNDAQVQIVKEIHRKRDDHLAKGSVLVTFKNKFTKTFKQSCIKVGLTDERINLHCLRHTFAVIQWIISNDIYEVKTLLGHSSVKTTERYARFNKDRLAQDFPSAYGVRLEVEKVRKNGVSATLISATLKEISESSSKDSIQVADC